MYATINVQGMLETMRKLKIEKTWILIFSIFYAIAGGAKLYLLILSNFTLGYVGVLGTLSLTTAYGLIKKKAWAVWLVAILLFTGITFGATTLYASIRIQTFNPNLEGLVFHLTLIVYIAMTIVASVYVLARREELQ
ncbi:MAG: hypothetical protein QW231_01910 [Candidatus Bathyarchaeia archaeon]